MRPLEWDWWEPRCEKQHEISIGLFGRTWCARNHAFHCLSMQDKHQDTCALEMIHNAPLYFSSSIVSKSIAKGGGKVDYRGQVTFAKILRNLSLSYIECDIDYGCIFRSIPFPNVPTIPPRLFWSMRPRLFKISEEQLYYPMSRGRRPNLKRHEMIVYGLLLSHSPKNCLWMLLSWIAWICWVKWKDQLELKAVGTKVNYF